MGFERPADAGRSKSIGAGAPADRKMEGRDWEREKQRSVKRKIMEREERMKDRGRGYSE